MTPLAHCDSDATQLEVDEAVVHQTMSITDNSIVVANKELLYCDLSDGGVILDLKSGVYYGLDAVGAHIWRVIQVPTSLRDITLAVQEVYDVATERCRHDLRNLLGEMIERKLLEVRNEQTL